MTLLRYALAVPALMIAAPGAAASADSDSPFTMSGGMTLVSDYRYRGISLSGKDPAIQGTFTVAHASGLYGGSWASSIDGGELYGHTEIDLYAGWSGAIPGGLTLDTMLAYYAYPSGDGSNAEYFEGTSKISRGVGPVTATVGAAYSWDQKALGGQDNLYLFAEAAAAVPKSPVTLKGHFGRSEGALAPGGTYLDWSLGLETKFGPLTAGINYVDTDLRRQPGADATVVLSVGAAF